MMSNNVTGEYTDKEVRQAKLELYRRSVNDKLTADIMEEKEETFMRRLDAAARAEQARLDKEREKNRNVSYRWWELIPMFLFAPFVLSIGMLVELFEILFLTGMKYDIFLETYIIASMKATFKKLSCTCRLSCSCRHCTPQQGHIFPRKQALFASTLRTGSIARQMNIRKCGIKACWFL